MKISANGYEYTIKFQHRRVDSGEGMTRCLVSIGSSSSFEGYAFCSPKDGFNKAIGRKISLTRALAVLPKSQRAAIWQGIFEERNRINAKPWTV